MLLEVKFYICMILITCYSAKHPMYPASVCPLFVIGRDNNFIEVIVDLQSSAIICKFINRQPNNLKLCSVVYGSGDTCDNLSNYGLGSDTTFTSESVIIHLPVLSQSTRMIYCYVVTASNDTFTAMFTGTFSTGKHSKHGYYIPDVHVCIDLLFLQHAIQLHLVVLRYYLSIKSVIHHCIPWE